MNAVKDFLFYTFLQPIIPDNVGEFLFFLFRYLLCVAAFIVLCIMVYKVWKT
jgi:hypothetical protein